jgi:hypothetical protein
MKDRIKPILLVLSVSLILLASAGCQTRASRPPAATTSPVVTTAAPVRELTDSTCADYLDLVAQVKREQEEPGLPLHHDAQDDLVSVMLWLHGYLSGRNGIDGQARPLTREWLASNVGVLAEACAVDEGRRVVDVVSGIR